jgi:signal transduction histidine kinase/CheY-like chemotaxis protein
MSKKDKSSELLIAKKEIASQKSDKKKRASELITANRELAFQDEEKEKRANELLIANKELAFQNEEKEKRAAELIIANKKLAFENKEKDKRAAELAIANEEKEKRVEELIIANKEKEKRANELLIANKELAFQNKEKEKRAAELILANKELVFQNEEKEKRAIELIKAKENAEGSDRLKSAFLANMSHEIRTPMNGILGFIELLKEPNLTGEEQHEYINIIATSGTRMLNIINDIISISKIESGQMEISISETNVNEQIEYIYTFFKPEAEQKQIHFSFKNSLPAEKANIKTDREKIYAILTNLIKNAIKFTNSGSIDFGYEKRDRYLEFFVKDTGLGIPQEKFGYIFERFRQGSDSLSRDYEGAGLGLSISKAFIEMLGGKIWIESILEKGSTFYFSIPYNIETQKDIFVKDFTLNEGLEDHRRNLKILIAEDDEVSQRLLALIVKRFCKKVLTAKTGVEAVNTCLKNPDIDLIMMDIKMPEMNGFEATEHIRQFNNDVIIIAQTAYGFSGDKIKALDAGCNDFISKPVLKDGLIKLINKYFNN